MDRLTKLLHSILAKRKNICNIIKQVTYKLASEAQRNFPDLI